MHDNPDEVTPCVNTREFRYFGPPGTGKTTMLTRQIRRAIEKYGKHGVLIVSFSKAAAAELSSRDLPKEQIGTLHSICYRALGNPLIAEDHVEEWNRKDPQREMSPLGKEGLDDAGHHHERNAKLPGNQLLAAVNYHRGQLASLTVYTVMERDFREHWEEYKRENDLMDFTDLIEKAQQNFRSAPGNPSVIFVDEAQDLNRMQMRLIRQWGSRCEFYITAGDDDQMIYDFIGCTSDAFLDPLSPLSPYAVHVLKQSFRVPAAVHKAAGRWIGRLEDARFPKVWMPRQ